LKIAQSNLTKNGMKYTYIFLIACLTSMFCKFSYSQENEKITIGEKIKFKSDVLGHERDIYIYLPSGYKQSNQTYPVVYTTDAEQSFLLMTSMFGIFPKGGILPNAIIVGIVNRGEQERYYDFAPVIKDKPESGRAELFISFLEKELFPYIEQNYRTQPFRIIFGHSFLGMFACHIFITHPELFQGYIISSPDLRWINEEISGEKSSKLTRPVFLYISKGAEEKPSKEIESFVGLLKSIDNLSYTYIENKGEGHQSNGIISIINGLRFIYTDWRLPKPPQKCSQSEIINHYKKLSEKYGYEIPNPHTNKIN
jgi:predicted alpha/beta superfamily hydrolase